MIQRPSIGLRPKVFGEWCHLKGHIFRGTITSLCKSRANQKSIAYTSTGFLKEIQMLEV